MVNGCAYGKVTRTIVVNNKEMIREIKDKIDSIDKRNTDMFNHMTDKLEKITRGKLDWRVVIIITILSNLCVGLLIKLGAG